MTAVGGTPRGDIMQGRTLARNACPPRLLKKGNSKKEINNDVKDTVDREFIFPNEG